MISAALCGDQLVSSASSELLIILNSCASIQFESLSFLYRMSDIYISLILQIHSSVRALVRLDLLNLFFFLIFA